MSTRVYTVHMTTTGNTNWTKQVIRTSQNRYALYAVNPANLDDCWKVGDFATASQARNFPIR